MLYKTELIIPPNTTPDIAVSADFLLMPGKVIEIGIGFPPGCNGLAHVVINEKLHQLWPSTDGESFHWDSILRVFSEDFELSEVPYTFTIWGWNYDILYPHTVTVEVNLLAGQSGWNEYLKRLISFGVGG
jgi:hypothetical protein